MYADARPLTERIFVPIDDDLLGLQPIILHGEWLVGRVPPLDRVVQELLLLAALARGGYECHENLYMREHRAYLRVRALRDSPDDQLSERACSSRRIEPRLRLRSRLRADDLE